MFHNVYQIDKSHQYTSMTGHKSRSDADRSAKGVVAACQGHTRLVGRLSLRHG